MTVSTDISSARYEGNGVTNTFSFNGRIFTNSDLAVDIITRSTDIVVETLSPSDYTVSLVSSESAEIIVAGPKIPSALQDILIYRNININQSLRLPTGTVFPASDVESALDRLTILIQDTQDDGSRSLIFPKNISGITTPYLPSPEDGKLLVWDGEAGNVANLSVTNLIDEGFDTIFTSLVATDFLQYDGASWVNIHNSDFPLQSIKAPTSSGIALKNNSGTTILTIGPSGASSATFAGTLNIPDGTVSTYAKIASGVFASLSEAFAGTSSKIINAATLATFNQSILWVREEQASGTAGGTFTSGAWRTRTLNTVKQNGISGASLASNQITLPAGTYTIEAILPTLNTNSSQGRLQNITDTSTSIIGQSGVTGTTAGGFVFVRGIFTVPSSTTKAFEIQHQCTTTRATDGFGFPSSLGTEVYTEVVIKKIG